MLLESKQQNQFQVILFSDDSEESFPSRGVAVRYAREHAGGVLLRLEKNRVLTAYEILTNGTQTKFDWERNELRKMEGDRKTFYGVFVRYGSKKAYRGPDIRTMLLKQIRTVDTDTLVCEHLWFTVRKRLAALGALQAGDVLQFDARVDRYEKGYNGWREDVYKEHLTSFRLSFPTKVTKVTEEIPVNMAVNQ